MNPLNTCTRWLPKLLAFCLTCAASSHAALIPVTTDIAAGTTVTWTANNTYRLDTVVYVQPNATLVIEPGTVVLGKTNVTIGRDGIPELVSALWVTRGGKLMANGTRENPIIFTAEGDNLNNNIPPTATALWGGVVIMGKATINSAKDTAGNVANPKFDAYEGVTGPGPNNEHLFGGNDDEDNSGVLRYVSIRHAGRTFAPAAELNALSMGGVGRGTTLEYIEVYAGSDDGFEWWGGTAGSKYLVAAFIEDDDFDTDQGYRGVNQFWFGIKPPWAGTGDSRGIESDGDLSQSASGEQPISRWHASNATLLGRGKSETASALGVAWNTRDEDAANVFNSVFSDWSTGLRLDADGLVHYTANPPLGSIRNNIWDVTTAANTDGQFMFSTADFKNTVGSAMLGGVSYTNNGQLDPRPQAGSAVFNDVLAGAPMAVNYRGAFSGPSDNWADGWTALSQYGFLKPASAAPVNNPLLAITREDVNVRIAFPTQVGFNYQVERTTSLSPASWSVVRLASFSGTGSVLSLTQTAADNQAFYRVVVRPE